jgi:hypothetical protein
VGPREEFTSTFDLGDNWRNRCVVEKENADPRVEYGPLPALRVAIWRNPRASVRAMTNK